MSEETILTEDSVTDDISPEAVKAYLEGNALDKQDDNSEDQLELKPVKNEDGTNTISFGNDTTFDTSNTPDGSAYDNMHINLLDDLLPITQEEKESYLIAMLNEEQYELDVTMFNKLTIRCRDLNVYEKHVVQRVLTDEVAKNPGTAPAAFFTMLRLLRVPMQIVSVNGKEMPMVKFDYDPDTVDPDQVGKDAETLLKKSMQLVFHTPVAKYDLYLKALNVFENKVLRLQEAAFNETFWKPADQDS